MRKGSSKAWQVDRFAAGTDRPIAVSFQGTIVLKDRTDVMRGFEDRELEEGFSSISRDELSYIYKQVMATRKNLVAYMREKPGKTNFEDVYERWGQVIALESILRFLREFSERKAQLEKETQHGSDKT